MKDDPSKICGEATYRLVCGTVRAILRAMFRVRAHRLDRWPRESGSAVVIGNHVSYLDPALHSLYLPRRISFAIGERVARKLLVRPFLKVTEAIPVSSERAFAIKALTQRAKAGAVVSLFPEGRISPTNALQKTYPGPAVIARSAGADLYPITVLGGENTIFGLAPGFCRRNLFSKIRLVVGEPVPHTRFSGLKEAGVRRELYQILAKSRVEAITLTETLSSFIRNRLRWQGGRGTAFFDFEAGKTRFSAVRKMLKKPSPRQSQTPWETCLESLAALIGQEDKSSQRSASKGMCPPAWLPDAPSPTTAILKCLAQIETLLDLGHRDRVFCLLSPSSPEGWFFGMAFPLCRGACSLGIGSNLKTRSDRFYRYDATWLVGTEQELHQFAERMNLHDLQTLRRVLCLFDQRPDPERIRALIHRFHCRVIAVVRKADALVFTEIKTHALAFDESAWIEAPGGIVPTGQPAAKQSRQ